MVVNTGASIMWYLVDIFEPGLLGKTNALRHGAAGFFNHQKQVSWILEKMAIPGNPDHDLQ